uniref:Peptidyl-tRNA hydrolase n=1 Tax=candidate division WOR-3 bacterium TaxID=2052148 RepID=A0A7V6CMM1_UNCW3
MNEKESPFIICGLGNPGKEYQFTRHNLGFLVLDSLAKDFQKGFDNYQFYACAKIFFSEKEVYLVKPLTYMNYAGVGLKEFLKNINYDLKKFLCILDDLNLPFGKIRIREKGSDGGHRGLASIIYYLATNEFARLRIGIGRPINMTATDYVLSCFSEEEKKKLPEIIEKAKKATLTFISEGIKSAMNKFNKNLP